MAAVKDGLSGRRGVWATADLCGLAARKDPRLLEAATDPRLAVIACHPRAVRWLLRWAGVETADTIRFWNLRTQDAATILAGLDACGRRCLRQRVGNRKSRTPGRRGFR